MTENPFEDRIACFDNNYPRVREELARAAERSGRRPEEITLLAATKTVPLPVVCHAIDQGIRCIGENRVQELLEKSDGIDRSRCDVQFIGRLQTNKVKFLPKRVSCIQSVDSLRLAAEISRLCQAEKIRMDVLVEVNIGREESKGGILPEALLAFIDQIREFPGIHVSGLMAIPPVSDSVSQKLKNFSAMRQYYVDIASKKMDNVFMDCLSMGMSDDFSQAIQCGATMVRVGSALFGARKYAAR